MITELEFVKNDIKYQLDHLNEYLKPKYVRKDVSTMFDDCFIKFDPYGVVLIFSAWNYPVQVLLGPLVGAIAAGNCAIIKPSEVAQNTEKLIAKLLPQYLDRVSFLCSSLFFDDKYDLMLSGLLPCDNRWTRGSHSNSQ